ncbi:MAG: glycosyltransferase family 2 protein [Candidatus Caldatribacteriota bacterium]|nr:glycosyltransferase family 2 protein [Candidatus Caldatribacteriota bacterium]
MSRKYKVVSIVPAHNEEKTIRQTIESLVFQTQPLVVIVAADNCTDKTVQIVKELEKEHSSVKLFITKNNSRKKAGAINQVIEQIKISGVDIDAILLMDADTRIAQEAVQKGYARLLSDNNLAAICSRAGVIPYKGKNPFKWILYQLQRLEYASFDTQRIETLGRIKVVHGMCGLHRWSAFKEVNGFNDSIVEDYDLTIKYKEAGYKVSFEPSMRAWTNVPTTLREWWRQRLRWHRGGIDTLRRYGWNNTTRMEIIQHFWVNFLMIFQFYFLVVLILMLIQGTLVMHGIVLAVMLLGLIENLYRLKYLEDRKLVDYLFRIILIPEMLYGLLNSINLYNSYYLSFFKKEQNW